jgi:uncharacterized oxidoreductase
MKFSGNTVLITGGSSGIGLELSKQLIAKNNKVIICGRSLDKLKQAYEQFPQLEIYQCDISNHEECLKLATWIKNHHPNLNVLINNAAIVHKVQFLQEINATVIAKEEIATNFLAPIQLIQELYSTINSNQNGKIVNVTTGLIYAPRADYPFYNATKSALHSFTQVFRKQTENHSTKVIEVMFPAVKTPWHKGAPPKIAITPKEAVDLMLTGLEKGKSEIRVAGVELLYKLSRIAPLFAFNKINSLSHE